MTSPILSGSTIKNSDIGSVSVHDFDLTTQAGIVNTAFEPGSPDLSVEFVAPLSGRVLVVVGGGLRSPNTQDSVQLAPEIREDDSSGAVIENPTTVANAWTSSGFITSNYQYGSMATVVPMDGSGPREPPFEPGRTYFARVVQRVDGGDGDIFNRDITIVPLPLGQVYSAVPLGLDTPPVRSGQDFKTQFNTGLFGDGNFGDPEFGLFFRGPASGRALIAVGGGVRDNTSNQRIRICPEVRLDDVNGEFIVDPLDHAGDLAFHTHGWSSASVTTSNYQYGSRIGFLGSPATVPIIPGQQYFARIAIAGGGNTDLFNRDLFVIGVP